MGAMKYVFEMTCSLSRKASTFIPTYSNAMFVVSESQRWLERKEKGFWRGSMPLTAAVDN